jgi:hypothetical protein
LVELAPEDVGDTGEGLVVVVVGKTSGVTTANAISLGLINISFITNFFSRVDNDSGVSSNKLFWSTFAPR